MHLAKQSLFYALNRGYKTLKVLAISSTLQKMHILWVAELALTRTESFLTKPIFFHSTGSQEESHLQLTAQKLRIK